MQFETAKHIVHAQKPSHYWFKYDYNMNIYRGCSHGCIYCDSRSDCYRVENFDTVRPKADALAIIEADLKSKRKKGIVATGAMSDPYNLLEKQLLLTRGALKLIDKYGFGASVTTKSALAARDTDILKSIGSHSCAVAKFTVTTFDDALCAKIEPHVSPTSERFKALEKLAASGVLCGLLLMPLLPFINDNEQNVVDIVRAAHNSGVKFIYFAAGVTLRANQRQYFFDRLDETFPGVKQRYIGQYGNAHSCTSAHAVQLHKAFSALCDGYGIMHKLPAINAYLDIMQNSTAQTSLF